MATFKNTTGHMVDIPLLELHVPEGDTFEVPDEMEPQFDANPWFTSSKAKSPDVIPDPLVVEAAVSPVTGAIPTFQPPVAPVAPQA